MNVQDKIKAAEAAVDAARQKHRELEHERHEQAEAAKREVYDRYADAIGRASKAVYDAEAALRAAKDQLPAHEWEGRRVCRVEERRQYTFSPVVRTRFEGVVETVRSNSVFKGNLPNWRRPRLGEVIVRLLKKDGSPGLDFKRFNLGDYAAPWELVEPEATRTEPDR